MILRRVGFFFFKQKTAYEITYGDWSSDVCSSDLRPRPARPRSRLDRRPARRHPGVRRARRSEERRVGKSVVGCVDLGGRRIIKKKKKKERRNNRSKIKYKKLMSNL